MNKKKYIKMKSCLICFNKYFYDINFYNFFIICCVIYKKKRSVITNLN